MKTKLTLVMAAMAAMTGMATAAPETPSVPAVPSVGAGNCDLMASNTVRAVFRGVQPADAQGTTYVALFEVVQNLAHQRVVRYGDGMMPVGMVFTVTLDKYMPGQPASVVDEIAMMQVGEEAVMKIDHLFLFNEPQGLNIRPCTRIARKPATAPGVVPGVVPAEMPQQVVPQPAMPQNPDEPLIESGVPTMPVLPGTPSAMPTAPTSGSGILYGTMQ